MINFYDDTIQTVLLCQFLKNVYINMFYGIVLQDLTHSQNGTYVKHRPEPEKLAGALMKKVMNHNGLEITVVVRSFTRQRLSNICFRSWEPRNLAGNFKFWNCPEDVLKVDYVMEELLAEVDDLYYDNNLGTHSVWFECDEIIGWDSTDAIENYRMDRLEYFRPNRHSIALKVVDGWVLAPQTKVLTLVFELRNEGGKPVVVIHSMYPGVDIGVLDGDVTEREGRVFLDWNHPGG